MNMIVITLILGILVVVQGLVVFKLLKEKKEHKAEMKLKDQEVDQAIQNAEKITEYFKLKEQAEKEGVPYEEKIKQSDNLDDLKSAFDANNERLQNLRNRRKTGNPDS